jgi:hypothetical protein
MMILWYHWNQMANNYKNPFNRAYLQFHNDTNKQ